MDQPLVDQQLINCIFSPRYLDFETCAFLEPVSHSFHSAARKYYSIIHKFDFENDVKFLLHRNLEQKQNLMRKLVQYCPNLREIRNFSYTRIRRAECDQLGISNEKDNEAISLLEFPRLTRFSFKTRKIDDIFESILGKLKHVTESRWAYKNKTSAENFDENRQCLNVPMPSLKHLNVSQLKTGRYELCNSVDMSKILSLNVRFFLEIEAEGMTNIRTCLDKCKSLNRLHIAFRQRREDFRNMVAIQTNTNLPPNVTFDLLCESHDFKQNVALMNRAGFLKRLQSLKFFFVEDETARDLIEMSPAMPNLRYVKFINSFTPINRRIIFESMPALQKISFKTYLEVDAPRIYCPGVCKIVQTRYDVLLQ